MYELAQLPAGATLSARDLCEVADVPENFGVSLVPFLIDAGLVRAEGYRRHLLSLAEAASAITIGRVVRASEPEFSVAQCSRDPESCSRSEYCGVHEMWTHLDTIIWAHLDTITLAQVVSDEPLRLSLQTVAARVSDDTPVLAERA